MQPTTLLVTPVSNLAGVARHLIDLASVGIPGWRMVVAAPEGPLLERLRELGCPVLPAALDSLPLPKAVAQLRDLVRRVRPQIVHSHLAKADILVTMATLGLPVRLVTTEHHIPPDRFMFHTSLPAAITMETMHHLRLRRFAAAMAVSASTARDMRKWWRTSIPIEVVLNGVDRLDPPPTRAPGLRLLSLCRLSPEKNVSASIRAFALIADEHPEATLTVAGEGTEREALEALAGQLGVAERVTFPGFVDPVAALESHDVLLQPSKSDNLSYTLLDALAHGMGVAASTIGGNPEILPPRCLCDADDVAGLARIAVQQGLHMDERPILGDHVPTVGQMARHVAELYDEVCR